MAINSRDKVKMVCKTIEWAEYEMTTYKIEPSDFFWQEGKSQHVIKKRAAEIVGVEG